MDQVMYKSRANDTDENHPSKLLQAYRMKHALSKQSII